MSQKDAIGDAERACMPSGALRPYDGIREPIDGARVREIFMEYVKAYLEHVNPYTGNTGYTDLLNTEWSDEIFQTHETEKDWQVSSFKRVKPSKLRKGDYFVAGEDGLVEVIDVAPIEGETGYITILFEKWTAILARTHSGSTKQAIKEFGSKSNMRREYEFVEALSLEVGDIVMIDRRSEVIAIQDMTNEYYGNPAMNFLYHSVNSDHAGNLTVAEGTKVWREKKNV